MMKGSKVKGGGHMFTVVFVCTGNTCRSPMAQGLLQHRLAEEAEAFRILSAGTYAADGSPAAEGALDVMSRRGIDLRGHRSAPLSDEVVAGADVLLVMTEAHKQRIVQQHPTAKSKTYTLKQFVGLSGDVQDPFGGDVAQYARTAAELDELLAMAAEKIMDKLQNRRTERSN